MHTPMYKNIYTGENMEAFESMHTNSASGLAKIPFECGDKKGTKPVTKVEITM